MLFKIDFNFLLQMEYLTTEELFLLFWSKAICYAIYLVLIDNFYS